MSIRARFRDAVERVVQPSRSGGSTIGDDGTTVSATTEPSGPETGDQRTATAGSAPAIRIDGLSKSYDDTTVFRDLDLEIADGEFVCLLGPSGCGKTTLLHVIAGLEELDEGRVTVDGEPVDGPDYRRGVVFQDPLLYPWLTVRENIEIGLRLRGEEPDPDHVTELIELIGLEGFEDAKPSSLSGGMAQRVSLARTLANDPELLLLDEPFGALDELTKMELQDELARIIDELGLTVVFVTHDIEEAVYLGDRVAVLGDEADLKGIEDVAEAGRARDDTRSMERRRDVFRLLEDEA